MVPYPVFSIFGKGVYLYGLFIAVGIIACFIVFLLYTKKLKMADEVRDFIFYVAIIAIILGFISAKLFQAIYEYIDTGVFDFFGSGITAMGGFVGGAAAFLLVYFIAGKFIFVGAKKGLHVKEFNKILLIAPCCILIAHAFGRIGCLMAGCCHGAFLGIEPVLGGIYMKGNGPYGWGYYVPTQLYESLFLFVCFGVLSLLLFKKCNITMQIYLIAYGLWRIFIEFFRTDERGAVVLGLYPSQWQSILFILGGVALLVIYAVKKIPFIKKEE